MPKDVFRLNNKKLFLTYPHCEYHPKVFINKLRWLIEEKGYKVNYMICSQESHENGAKHMHVYFELVTAIVTRNERVFDVEGYHPNIEVVKSTPWKTVRYVKKDGFFEEYQPENAPVVAFDSMNKREKNQFLIQNDPVQLYEDGVISAFQCERIIKSKQFIENYKLKNAEKKKPVVLWFFGRTGSGKTRTAIEIAEDFGYSYWISNDPELKWFDGYHRHDVAIIDDFRRQGVKYNFVLRLLDRYKIQVPIKGGYTWWMPKVIIITCPVDVKTCYTWLDRDGEEHDWDGLDQLLRRIDDEINFDE